ncbi:DUF6543 domain-containing protein [Pseudomonas sp. RW3S2]|uniref:DUF6543 domain-containing protein n=1 Tax=Pseudomonas sp. RW3S2 TaxID=485884 RepID=UPI00164730EF|nr:DUF6543 domain-containing protein [Pseudomonas sp. RW3S2]MBC3420616.1 hypothetical protein [Pseudomonas sp. RW3S2]
MSLSSPHPQVGDLDCEIAKHFQTRPSLQDVASRMLRQQWLACKLDPSLDPATLSIRSTGKAGTAPYQHSLTSMLIQRHILKTTLNLTPLQDTLVQTQPGLDDKTLETPLHPIEALINETAPFLLKEYRQALTDYWVDADKHDGKSPWQWCSQYLRERYKKALDEHRKEQWMDDRTLAVAQQLLDGTSDTQDPVLHNVRLDMLDNWQLDPDLASALLIESPASEDKEAVTLLFTTSGRLLQYQSRNAMLARARRRLPAVLPPALKMMRLIGIPGRPFDNQASGLLQQQLHGSLTVTSIPDRLQRPNELALALDRITSMLSLCGIDDTAAHDRLAAELPVWLRNAQPEQLQRYALVLTDIAQTYEGAGRKGWLDGILDAQAFAYAKLYQCILKNHPDFDLDLKQLRVANHQVTAVAIPGAGSLVTSGSIHVERFDLAQLAIANLGLLQPGKVVVESIDGSDVPAWFDESYLRALITQADIAKHYPQMLRAKLLEDPQAAQRRTALLRKQLRSQLPLLVMDLNLRGLTSGPDLSREIAEVFATPPTQSAQWYLRPFALLSSLDASPDPVSNTWLIEQNAYNGGPCLLYRPLLATPLSYFQDRMALFEALATPGDLQDDILQRLPEQARKVYAYGGFREPHLFHPGEDDWAVPFGKPAPASLSIEPPCPDPASALYKACVEETIAQFSSHAQSSEQARWARWQTLGWLLLNTVLPFAPESVATAGWIVQMETTFLQATSDRPQDTSDRAASLVELLLNLATLLFAHARRRIDLQRPLEPPIVDPLATPNRDQLPTLVNGSADPLADFSWSNPLFKLDSAQRQSLLALRAPYEIDELGPPIPQGALQGLFLHDARTWVSLGGSVYEVQLDPVAQRQRIIDTANPDKLGPWIRREEDGRWGLDLRLHLKGGMPLGKRITQLRAENAKALATLNATIIEERAQSQSRQQMLVDAVKEVGGKEDEASLHKYLGTAKECSTFWGQHLEHLRQRNERAVLEKYKIRRAFALSQHVRCEQEVFRALNRLHEPLRARMLEMYGRQNSGHEITPAEATTLTECIEKILLLLDQMVEHGSLLTEQRAQLEKLRSEHQPEISSYIEVVDQGGIKPPSNLVLRWMRIEACTNRMTMLQQLDEDGSFWMKRAWNNLQMSITQHLQLARLKSPGEEVTARVLYSISGQLRTARRQLNNLISHMDPERSHDELKRMEQDFDAFTNDVAKEADELPEFIPVSTVQQLRAQLPGLIETQEHGILLGTVREGNPNIVDIPTPASETPSRSYTLQDDRWVELEVAAPEAAPVPAQPPNLKRLLKSGKSCMAAARTELVRLGKSYSNNYLPVEIEEILTDHRASLDSAREAIERRLTADNATDEASADSDAAIVIKEIEDLAAQLTTESLRLRTKAALKQKPRMGELQFLIKQNQVTISPVGTRKALTKVKGRPADFLDEYVVQHDEQAIWYAHFHYRSKTAAKVDFVAGHLKLASQRFAQGKTVTNPQTLNQEEVYRSPISLADAKQYFFTD